MRIRADPDPKHCSIESIPCVFLSPDLHHVPWQPGPPCRSRTPPGRNPGITFHLLSKLHSCHRDSVVKPKPVQPKQICGAGAVISEFRLRVLGCGAESVIILFSNPFYI